MVENLTLKLQEMEASLDGSQQECDSLRKKVGTHTRTHTLYLHICVYGRTRTHTHARTHACTHTHTHTHTHTQITVIEQELVNSQEEVHEVMQALEELAVSYDTKDRDVESTMGEKQLLMDEIEQLQVCLKHSLFPVFLSPSNNPSF